MDTRSLVKILPIGMTCAEGGGSRESRKAERLLVVGCILFGLCASGANWTNYLGGELETPSNWDGPVTSATDAVFALPLGTVMTVTTATGFTNRHTTVTAPEGDVTFTILPGLEYSVEGDYRLASTGGGWSCAVFNGGGSFATGGAQGDSTLHVGSAGQNNTLTVTGGISLTCWNLYTGWATHNNTFNLSNATCTVQKDFSLGYYGNGNRAVISGNAVLNVPNTSLTIGHTDGEPANNSMLVDNASVVSRYLSIGRDGGGGNQLEITRGGEWTCLGAGNNEVIVLLGERSRVQNIQNTLTVSDGGMLTLTNRSGATFSIGHATPENSVTVTGTGSSITGTGAVYVGNGGGGRNSLTVADGGLVDFSGAMTFGYGGAPNNTARVENATINVGSLMLDWAGSLTLAGTNPVLAVGGNMIVKRGASLHFEFGNAAPTNALITAGTLYAADEPDMMTIDATQLNRTSGGKGIVLIRSGTQAPAPDQLSNLVKNFDYDASAGNFTVRLSEDGKEILCDVVAEGGTLIMVK